MRIAVYCGASTGNSQEYINATKELGAWMGKHGYDLVYGGGNAGLMGLIADTVIDAGCNVTGIIPSFLVERELAKDNITVLEIVDDMHERKRKMMELANAYIALPGGPGTLEEIAEVISWGRIGQHTNPCILLNYNGFYDSLKSQYEHMVKEGFLTQEDFDKVLFAESIDEIKPFIDSYVPPKIREYSK